MEIQRPSYHTYGYSVTSTCYSSFCYKNSGSETSLVSGTVYSPSFLPRIVDSAPKSKRTEWFGPTSRTEKPKVIRPSKHGYHRHGNTPTFKLLTEVREKLQVLVDRQSEKNLETNLKQENEIKADSDEYFGDCSSSAESGCVSPSSSAKCAVLLELNYSSDISSRGSITVSPVMPVHKHSRRSANTQLHLYLPRLTETTENADSPGKGNERCDTKSDNSTKTPNQDYANFYNLRHGLDDRDDRKSFDYKRSPITYSKNGSKSGHKKSKSKKSKVSKSSSKKVSSSADSKSSTSVLPNIKNDTCVTSQNKEVQSDYVDFLNDVPTLISEQKDMLQFSESSYTLPDLNQTCDVPQNFEESNNFSNTLLVPRTTGDLWISEDYNRGKAKPDCSVCKYSQSSTAKFVDRLYGIGANDKDDLNNNTRANRDVGCVKC